MSDKTVPQLLREAAKTYEERNALYGDNYKHFGEYMAALFPNGLSLRSPEDFIRIGLLTMIASKIGRYAANFQSGGHKDSAHDLSVYAAMLEEMTNEHTTIL